MLQIILLLSLLCFTYAEQQDGAIVVVDDGKDYYRALAVTKTSDTIAVGGFEYEVEDDDEPVDESVSAKLNAAVFKFQNGNGKDPLWYFGTASASYTGSWTAAGGFVGKVDAATCEVVLGIQSLIVYENHDDNPGFDYEVGQKLVCPPSNEDPKKDCLVEGTAIPLNSLDVTWSTILVAETDCPSGYDPKCKIYNITTKATYQPLLSTPYDIAYINFFLSNQKIKIGSNEVGNNIGKVDWILRYPWDHMSNKITDSNNAHLTVVSYAAGKATEATATVRGGENGFAFESNGNVGYVTFSSSSTVDSTDSPTHTSTISGDDVLEYKPGSDIATNIIYGWWQFVFGIWKGFGWSCEIVFVSWSANKPINVYYDPTFGQTTGSALGLAPGLMIPLLVCISQYLFNKLF